jgi:hypothetical protein
MNKQFDHLHDDSLHGLVVRVPDTCKCGAVRATIGAGAGPHACSLGCVECETHRGWLSRVAYDSLIEIIPAFRPIGPVGIPRGRPGAQP